MRHVSAARALRENDSLQSLNLLQPLSADDASGDTWLETSASWGQHTENLPRLTATIDVLYPALNMSAQLNATLFVGDVDMALGTRLNYDLNRLADISLAGLMK